MKRSLWLKKYDMEIEVLAQDDLEEIGAGALLAVNQGSDRPCFMVVIRYDGGKQDEDYTALVGKVLHMMRVATISSQICMV